MARKWTIDIICPVYEGERYILNLNASLLKQKDVDINKIVYILTESNDSSEQILKDNNLAYEKIKKKDFSHSGAREEAAKKSTADIIAFITQDVEIRDNSWLKNLVLPIISGEASACYSRQITKYNNIEKYTREKNYPNESYIKSKNDIDKMGVNTFFYSDASSAIDNKVFRKLNYYDGKKFMFNEDMYIAYKLIMNGYKIAYCANSVVYHSHKLTLKQTYDRYKASGKFFKENEYFDKYHMNGSGLELAKYIIKRAFQDGNIGAIIRWLPDMGARYLGMKAGKKHSS